MSADKLAAGEPVPSSICGLFFAQSRVFLLYLMVTKYKGKLLPIVMNGCFDNSAKNYTFLVRPDQSVLYVNDAE